MPPKCFCYIKWPANTLESSAPTFTDSLETAQAVSHPCLSSLSSYVHMSAARFHFLWWSRALYLHIGSLYMKYIICQLRYQFTSIFSQLVVDTKPFTSKSILNFCSQAKIQGILRQTCLLHHHAKTESRIIRLWLANQSITFQSTTIPSKVVKVLHKFLRW